MTPQDFLEQVIRPTLTVLNLGGTNAENLLLGTALQESGLRDIPQDRGPALGYFQMEPATHDDLWKNFLSYKTVFSQKVKGFLPAGVTPSASQLIPYPQYACAMARMLYERAQGAIPSDLEGQANYYKLVYNTRFGAATPQEYINNWNAAMGGTETGGTNA